MKRMCETIPAFTGMFVFLRSEEENGWYCMTGKRKQN
jgi:hypothetical protein